MEYYPSTVNCAWLKLQCFLFTVNLSDSASLVFYFIFACVSVWSPSTKLILEYKVVIVFGKYVTCQVLCMNLLILIKYHCVDRNNININGAAPIMIFLGFASCAKLSYGMHISCIYFCSLCVWFMMVYGFSAKC